MRIRALGLSVLLATSAIAQPRPQDEVASLKVAGMDRVVVRKNIAFDGELKLDLYRPSEVGVFPAVIFVNGVTSSGRRWISCSSISPTRARLRGVLAYVESVESLCERIRR